MYKYINKTFETLDELTAFLNEEHIPQSHIVYVNKSCGSSYEIVYLFLTM